ncbi:hypothetical protein DFH08DRAFT_797487 [Mycena albidolilacea]|uniref:FAD-binding domain-containing protein n=1 Tax=Mycena albidolilacea TaxID=1033008 RepID=A0AAD7AR86_9AGAR|nr:hypothetical protein DFH08DRAFT_797487 [Mycena albidolilacea]
MALKLNSKVVSIDAQEGKVTLGRGEIISNSVIIGADSIKCLVRDAVAPGPPIPPVPIGYAAYRALKTLVDRTEMTIWMGPAKHIMHRWIQRGKAEYNLAMVRPDDGEKESYTTEGSVKNMRADFTGWEQVHINSYAWFSTMIWLLLYRQPLYTWVASSGKVVLLDDACHPMLPSRARGCADHELLLFCVSYRDELGFGQVKDAAVLGVSSFLASIETRPVGFAVTRISNFRYDRTAQSAGRSPESQRLPP